MVDKTNSKQSSNSKHDSAVGKKTEIRLIVRMDYLFMMSERQKPLVQRNNLNDKMNATIHLKIKSGRKIRYN